MSLIPALRKAGGGSMGYYCNRKRVKTRGPRDTAFSQVVAVGPAN